MKITSFIFTLFVLISCEYRREQKIPERLKSVLKNECCLPGTYCAKVYEIHQKSELNQWNKNLFCEGVDDITLQTWVGYSELPKKTQQFISENIKYWNDTNYKCDIFKTLVIEKLNVAACYSENINPTNNKTRTFYHSIYLLDEDKNLFFDIQYIN